jgi:gas vesicle protein GvpG
MLLVDDLLFSPVKGILWIFREIHNAAREELASEPESISQQLRNLYMQLETSAISEQQFDAQEKVLLDRLDEIDAQSEPGQDQDETESEETLEETPAHGKNR